MDAIALELRPRKPILTLIAMRPLAPSCLVAFALMSGFSSLSAHPVIAASAVANPTWAVSSNQAAAAAVTYSFSSTTVTAGIIKAVTVTISGAGLGGTPSIALNYGIGAGTVAMARQVITYSLTAVVNVPAGDRISLQFSGITNPAVGDYTAAIVTTTAAGATIDRSAAPAVTFAAGNTAESIVVGPSLTFSLDVRPCTLTRDPTVPRLVYHSYTTNITVLTNANSGYTLTVSDNATGLEVAWPSASANDAGYTVTGTGAGDVGFSINAAFAGGTKYPSERSTGIVVAQSTTATAATANTIAITDRTAVESSTQARACVYDLGYIVTANYN